MATILPKLTRLDKPVSPDTIGIADSPFGELFMAWQGAHLVRLTLANTVDQTRYSALARDDERANDVATALFPDNAWQGRFTAPLSLGLHASDFEFNVLQAMNDIPPGEVVSYGTLAILAGKIGAARAAGSVCAKNSLLFALPCHRVVQSNGAIGGYLHGADFKRALLRAEGCRFTESGAVLS